MCLSGGVDSSVSLALLKKAGYDVMAAFMINYDEQRNGESCWRPDYQDALRVAAKLGVKLLRLDFTADYSRDVLQYMYKEYEAGLILKLYIPIYLLHWLLPNVNFK